MPPETALGAEPTSLTATVQTVAFPTDAFNPAGGVGSSTLTLLAWHVMPVVVGED
jgi:hypothetical protein